MNIKVTRYHIPIGKHPNNPVIFTVPPILEKKTQELLDAGLSFSIETGGVGGIVVYISDNKNEEDLGIEFTEDGVWVAKERRTK